MAETKIEWTDVTDNIIVAKHGGWWCRRVSPGCDHCYAEAINQNSFFGGNGLAYRGAPPELKLRQDVIDSWARQKKAKKHFVASMTDIFGEWVPREMIFKFLDGMLAAPRQTFQLLTKRPDIMSVHIGAWLDSHHLRSLPLNIWPGVTVENQEWSDKRREAFKAVPAATKFVSYEPALGSVNWQGWEFVSQIIAGGESGKNARPAHPDWFRNTRDWCKSNGKAFFFKQHGEWKPFSEMSEAENNDLYRSNIEAKDGEDQDALDEAYGRTCRVEDSAIGYGGHIGYNRAFYSVDSHYGMQVFKVGKKAAGRLLDGVEWSEFPR